MGGFNRRQEYISSSSAINARNVFVDYVGIVFSRDTTNTIFFYYHFIVMNVRLYIPENLFTLGNLGSYFRYSMQTTFLTLLFCGQFGYEFSELVIMFNLQNLFGDVQSAVNHSSLLHCWCIRCRSVNAAFLVAIVV